MTGTDWIEAREIAPSDLVKTPKGDSSRARFEREEDARSSSEPFLRVERVERTGADFAVPPARGETWVWLSGGRFFRWPDEARVLRSRLGYHLLQNESNE